MKYISIIMPVYNVEQYLEKSILSVLEQTYRYFELLIIDDGCTDKSGEICEKYEKEDNRVRIIHQENRGLSHAIRVGVEHASYDYIGFVDPDDYIDPHMYASLMSAISDADMAECGYAHVDDTGKIIRRYCHSDRNGVYTKKNGTFDFDMIPLLNNRFDEFAPRVIRLFKKAIFQKPYSYQIDDITQGEDLVLTYPIITLCNKIAYVPDIFYFYYQRQTSMAHTKVLDLENFKHVCDVLIQSYQQENIDVDEDAVRLSMLRQIVLGKIRYTVKDKEEKAKAYKKLLADRFTFSLIKKSKYIAMDTKSRIIFFCLSHNMVGLLAQFY